MGFDGLQMVILSLFVLSSGRLFLFISEWRSLVRDNASSWLLSFIIINSLYMYGKRFLISVKINPGLL